MTRKETTKFLSTLLEVDKLSGMGKHWAKEVSIDYGSEKVKRVDYMQFSPQNTMSIDGIEKGIFTCYEIKSCKEDLYSGNGLNFLGEKNYIVTTMECYKSILPDLREGKLNRHIMECCPQSSFNYGFMVAVPKWADVMDEFENPTSLDSETNWQLAVIYPCHQGKRKRSITELLFLMLRSGR